MSEVDKLYYPVLKDMLAFPLDLPLRVCANLPSSNFDKMAKVKRCLFAVVVARR